MERQRDKERDIYLQLIPSVILILIILRRAGQLIGVDGVIKHVVSSWYRPKQLNRRRELPFTQTTETL